MNVYGQVQVGNSHEAETFFLRVNVLGDSWAGLFYPLHLAKHANNARSWPFSV